MQFTLIAHYTTKAECYIHNIGTCINTRRSHMSSTVFSPCPSVHVEFCWRICVLSNCSTLTCRRALKHTKCRAYNVHVQVYTCIYALDLLTAQEHLGGASSTGQVVASCRTHWQPVSNARPEFRSPSTLWGGRTEGVHVYTVVSYMYTYNERLILCVNMYIRLVAQQLSKAPTWAYTATTVYVHVTPGK